MKEAVLKQISDANKIITEWKLAYLEENGKEAPSVHYLNGWFRIGNGLQRYRKKQIVQFTQNLRTKCKEEKK